MVTTNISYACMKCMLVCSVMSDSLRHLGLQPGRLLCPWDFLGKHTEVGYRLLLQGIFLTHGWNPHFLCLLNCKADCLFAQPSGSPISRYNFFLYFSHFFGFVFFFLCAFVCFLIQSFFPNKEFFSYYLDFHESRVFANYLGQKSRTSF